MKMNFNPRLTVIAAALIAAGCAGTPVSNQAIDQARATYQQAAADPQVQQHAQSELRAAAGALADAERMAKENADGQQVNHNAYLAEQRARAAMRVAETRRSEGAIAAATEERRRIQLEARDREITAAQEKARQAEAAKLQAEQQAKQQVETARLEADARARAGEEERLAREQSQATAASSLSAEVKRLESELADVKAKQTERGWVLSMKNELLFDPGKATLKDGAQRALNTLAGLLNKHADRSISIEGFTDSTGTKELNQRLSEQRADAVKEALVARGIEPKRIDTRGYGPQFPIASNDTPVGRQLNRRVEIVIPPS
jgi:outer membrane protein OmpA-like peptidoglycan-associated protein